jgi:hypothetical protein
VSAFLDLNALECDGVMVQWDAGWRRITFAGYHRDMQLTFTERRHGREKKRASNAHPDYTFDHCPIFTGCLPATCYLG